MDEFAQTRAPDDLFDDDFTPLLDPTSQPFEPQVHYQSPDISQYPESQPVISSNGTFQPHEDNRTTNSNGHSHNAPISDTTFPTKSPVLPAAAEPQPELTSNIPDLPPLPASSTTSQPQSQTPIPSQSSPQPTVARTHVPVRGDRHLTGGLAKPKLTEEELSAKMAAAQLNSAKRAEAHRLAEADEASFHQREAKAHARREEEGKARRQMDMEREKNRVRKLGAQKGREWDEGKAEEEALHDRRSQYRRGANGGIAFQSHATGNGSEHASSNDRAQDSRDGYESRGRGRGRGGRGGGGGGGGRGRGNAFAGNNARDQAASLPDATRDFPALPTPSKTASNGDTNGTKPPPPSEGQDGLKTTSMGGASWADQVAAADAK